MNNVIGISLENLILYRVMSFDHLLDLLQCRSVAMPKPSAWDDPFENVLERLVARDVGGGHNRYHFDHVLGKWYGLCWTYVREESDATWRIYSPQKDGVRIECDARYLFEQLVNHVGTFAPISCFIGKVQYIEQAVLVTSLNDPRYVTNVVLSQQGLSAARFLLTKRKEFSHEQEVRLLCRSPNDDLGSLLRFPVDPIRLIRSVVVDPRVDPNSLARYGVALRSAGYSGPISQSSLYQIPAGVAPRFDPNLGPGL